MKLPATIKTIIIETVCLLYVALFVYAAVSKLLDFENFQVQLGQSPLLSAFAGWVSWGVPIIELLIAGLLCFQRTRLIALYASFYLMTMFSIYIIIILNFSPFVPCSCGGILENMNWEEHLYFNVVFSILALIALFLFDINIKYVIIIRSITILTISIVLMTGLFLSSESIVHHRNNFIRTYPPFPAKRIKVKNLGYNSYYFAGKSNDKLYLGNSSAPALITELNSALQMTRTYQIQISDTLFNFHNVQLRVIPPYFYVFDGTVPCIFKGNLNDNKAFLLSKKIPGFTKAEVIDSSTFIIRTLSNTRENLLARLNIQNGRIEKYAPEILQKQIDGLFDTDGTLQYSEQQKKFLYLYYYRNQYIVTDQFLNLIKRGNTIDTTSKAKIKIEYVKKKKQRKFSAPPLLINRISTLHNNLLFVNSTLPGRYDEKKMWKNANVIDVYDILSKSYVFSFYIYKIDGDKIDDLIVTDTHLFAILGTKIVSYKLGKELIYKYKN